MRRTRDGFRAHELETIVAPESGEYANKSFYIVEGQPGLWRRLTAKDGKAKAESDAGGVLSVWFDGGIVPLVRVGEVEGELREAGFAQDALLTLNQRRELIFRDSPASHLPIPPFTIFTTPVRPMSEIADASPDHGRNGELSPSAESSLERPGDCL